MVEYIDVNVLLYPIRFNPPSYSVDNIYKK